MTGTEPLPEGSNPRRSTVFRMFAKAVVGVLVGALLVDLVVGWLDGSSAKETGRGVFQRDAELGWSNTPNYSGGKETIDALGLRTPPIPSDAPTDEVRILLCGASNSYGLYVQNEETWAYRLQESLVDEMQPAPRILNGAVQGYSIIQSCRRAARLIGKVQPDLVLVLLMPSRQALMDGSPALQWTRVGQDLVPTDLLDGWPASLHSVPARIHKLSLHSNLYRRYRTATKFGASIGKDVTFYVMSEEPPPEKLREPLAATMRELQGLIDYAALMEVEVRFILTLQTLGLNDEKWAAYIANPKHGGAPEMGTPKEEPIDALARWIEPLDADVWDFRDVMFEMGAAWKKYVMPANLHWSPAGHALMAEAIEARLRGGLLESLQEQRRQSPRTTPPPAEGEGQ